MTREDLRQTIKDVLTAHDGCSLDDPADRERVEQALWEALVEKATTEIEQERRRLFPAARTARMGSFEERKPPCAPCSQRDPED